MMILSRLFVVVVVGVVGVVGGQGQGQGHGGHQGQDPGQKVISAKYTDYYQQKPQQQQQQQLRPQYPTATTPVSMEKLTSSEERELEEELEEQKPDRLQELMINSKFECGGKKDGYYADDSLNCEVFHYCQANTKHSWLCPNQFAFHQIHLICVPPSSDSICAKSPDFHFVNDYLYRPINQRQADAYNTSLKYAERFFPEGYGGENGNRELMPHDNSNNNNRYYDDSSEETIVPESMQSPRQPVPQQQRPTPHHHRLTNHQNFIQQDKLSPRQQYSPPQQQQQQYSFPRQPQQQSTKHQNYYQNPNEINIPLSSRRPVPSNKVLQGTAFRPSIKY